MVKDIPPLPPTKSTKSRALNITNNLIDIWVNFHHHPYSYKIEFVKKKKAIFSPKYYSPKPCVLQSSNRNISTLPETYKLC